MRMPIKQLGITLIEMLITMIVVGILAGIAFPSYQNLVQSYRARDLSTAFTSSLALARTEAVKRGEPVTICAAGDANFTSCGNNTNWTDGWIVFVDPNNDGVIANATDRIKTQEATAPGTVFNTGQSRVTFNSRGASTTGVISIVLNASNCTGNHGRQIDITPIGRVLVTEIPCA